MRTPGGLGCGGGRGGGGEGGLHVKNCTGAVEAQMVKPLLPPVLENHLMVVPVAIRTLVGPTELRKY